MRQYSVLCILLAFTCVIDSKEFNINIKKEKRRVIQDDFTGTSTSSLGQGGGLIAAGYSGHGQTYFSNQGDIGSYLNIQLQGATAPPIIGDSIKLDTSTYSTLSHLNFNNNQGSLNFNGPQVFEKPAQDYINIPSNYNSASQMSPFSLAATNVGSLSNYEASSFDSANSYGAPLNSVTSSGGVGFSDKNYNTLPLIIGENSPVTLGQGKPVNLNLNGQNLIGSLNLKSDSSFSKESVLSGFNNNLKHFGGNFGNSFESSFGNKHFNNYPLELPKSLDSFGKINFSNKETSVRSLDNFNSYPHTRFTSGWKGYASAPQIYSKN